MKGHRPTPAEPTTPQRRSIRCTHTTTPRTSPGPATTTARVKIPGLPGGFRFHDLRHYFASLLIADGLDVETVQARLRHASARTTLDVYGHLWPDKDEATPRDCGGRNPVLVRIACGILRNPR